MAVWRYINMSFPEARRLADLTGIEQDLSIAESLCELFIEERQKSTEERDRTPPKIEVWEALTVAASVRYARAFAKGVRTRGCKMVEKVVRELPDDLIADHQRYLDFRNKYIAHSVNPFEENRVVAYLVPEERGPKAIASISVQHERFISLGIEDAKCLKNLCVKLRSCIKEAAGATQVSVDARFAEEQINTASFEHFMQPCRSTGALERALLDALGDPVAVSPTQDAPTD